MRSITSSPLISPRLWESRLTHLRYGGLQGLSGTAMLQGGLAPHIRQVLDTDLRATPGSFYLAIAVLFHTKQGFASLAA